MELFSEKLETAQDLFVFLQSIGQDARERLVLELNVGDHAQAFSYDSNITASAVEIVEDGALIQVFSISSAEED